jgi:hypothetical protein
MLISYGNGALQDHVVLELDGEALQKRTFSFKRFDHRGLELGRQTFNEAWIQNGGAPELGTAVLGLFSPTQARVVTVGAGDTGVSEVSTYTASDPFAQVLGLIRTFVNRDHSGKDEALSFYETDTELVATGRWQGKEIASTSPLYRSSFLPGQLFSQRFASFWIDRGGRKQPGLFVDNSRLFGPYALAWTLTEDGRLTAPAAMTFEVPASCRPLNPATLSGEAYMTQVCIAEESAELRLVKFE